MPFNENNNIYNSANMNVANKNKNSFHEKENECQSYRLESKKWDKSIFADLNKLEELKKNQINYSHENYHYCNHFTVICS